MAERLRTMTQQQERTQQALAALPEEAQASAEACNEWLDRCQVEQQSLEGELFEWRRQWLQAEEGEQQQARLAGEIEAQ